MRLSSSHALLELTTEYLVSRLTLEIIHQGTSNAAALTGSLVFFERIFKYLSLSINCPFVGTLYSRVVSGIPPTRVCVYLLQKHGIARWAAAVGIHERFRGDSKFVYPVLKSSSYDMGMPCYLYHSLSSVTEANRSYKGNPFFVYNPSILEERVHHYPPENVPESFHWFDLTSTLPFLCSNTI